MKVGLSVWQGRVAPVFDVSRELLCLEVLDGQAAASTSFPLEESATAKTRRITELAVETLICGAISSSLHRLLESAGVRVIPFVAGELDEVLRAYLAAELPSPRLSMPGCRGCPRGLGRGRRHRHRTSGLSGK